MNRRLLGELARRTPLPGRDTLAFIDIDAMQKRVYGPCKQGAAFGHTKIQRKSLLVRGLNARAAAISTPLGAPVVAATRLRGGNANSARGAAPGSSPRSSAPPARSGAAGCSSCGRTLRITPRRSAARSAGAAPVLGHGEHGPQDRRGHRRYPGGSLDGDPVPACDLG